MTYRLVLDEHRRFCERLAQHALRLAWQRQHVHERLVHSLIHCALYGTNIQQANGFVWPDITEVKENKNKNKANFIRIEYCKRYTFNGDNCEMCGNRQVITV